MPRQVGSLATDELHGSSCSHDRLARVLRAQGDGRIVVLSSVAGYRVRAANFVYGATKAGLDGFALGLGDALAGSGVEVMVVRPGFVRTKMTAGQNVPPFAIDAVRRRGCGHPGSRDRTSAVVWAPSGLRYVFGILRLAPLALAASPRLSLESPGYGAGRRQLSGRGPGRKREEVPLPVAGEIAVGA